MKIDDNKQQGSRGGNVTNDSHSESDNNDLIHPPTYCHAASFYYKVCDRVNPTRRRRRIL